jgi:hypothetical protein
MTSGAPAKRWVLWLGRAFSAVPVILLVLSASLKLSHSAQFAQQWREKFGFSTSTLTPIGLLELCCVTLYVIPRTAVLGALLVGCYLAGATCAHVRIGDLGAIGTVLLGVFAWLGIYLRDERLHLLLPIRQR